MRDAHFPVLNNLREDVEDDMCECMLEWFEEVRKC